MIYVVIIDLYNFFVGYYGNIEGICKGVWGNIWFVVYCICMYLIIWDENYNVISNFIG